MVNSHTKNLNILTQYVLTTLQRIYNNIVNQKFHSSNFLTPVHPEKCINCKVENMVSRVYFTRRVSVRVMLPLAYLI